MKLKELFTVGIALFLLTACVPTPTPTPHPDRNIRTATFQVANDGALRFAGQSTLPDSHCLQARLLQGEAPVAGWPELPCIAVQNGTWEFSLPPGQVELQPDREYRLEVWDAENPALYAEPFALDLSAPPTETGAFARVRHWLSNQGESLPDQSALNLLRGAYVADMGDWLNEHLDPLQPLNLEHFTDLQNEGLPGEVEVIPVELDGAAPEELFIVVKANPAPLLYARLRSETWEVSAVPAALLSAPAVQGEIYLAPNLMPAGARAEDLTGDGSPEVIVTHTFIGASNWRNLVQVLRFQESGWATLFRAELVNWAGPATWTFEPGPDQTQQIRLTYPIFLSGRDFKGGLNPEGTQIWRWDPMVDHFILARTQVGLPSPPGISNLNKAEFELAAGNFQAALESYDAFLADSSWKAPFLDEYQSAEPGAGERELLAWLDVARLHRGLSLAILGETRSAKTALETVRATGALTGTLPTPTIARLADAFLKGYGARNDLLAGMARYEQARIAGPSEMEQPEGEALPSGVVRALLPRALPLLAALAQAEPQNAADALEKAGFSDGDLLLGDTDADGRLEAAWRSRGAWPLVWEQVWLIERFGERWEATGLAAAQQLTLENLTPADAAGRRSFRVRRFDEAGREIPVAPTGPWPILGDPGYQ